MEFQRTEEKLQEERMERVKQEVELGREKDCNRVRKCTFFVYLTDSLCQKSALTIETTITNWWGLCDEFMCYWSL